MEKHFVMTKTQRDALMQYISETAAHRAFQEVNSVLKILATLPEAELPLEQEKTDGE